MTGRPFVKGKANRGRPKGSKNRVPAAVKEMVVKALDELGGVDYLVRQGRKKNPAAFLGLVGRALPLQHTGDGGGPVEFSFAGGEAITSAAALTTGQPEGDEGASGQ